MFKYWLPYKLRNAYELKNYCECGAVSSEPYIWKPDLLEGPVESECLRHTIFDQKSCFRKWSTAIPLGPCKEREAIEQLIELGHKRDYHLDMLEKIESQIINGVDKNEVV